MSDKKFGQENEAERAGSPENPDPENPRGAESGSEPEQTSTPAESLAEEHADRENRSDEGEKSGKQKSRKKDVELKTLLQDRDALKDKYLRALAEMENLRKRAEREKSEFYKFALSDVLKDILVVLDSFERALSTEDQTDGKVFQEGVRMIYRQLMDILAKKGVTPIRDVVGSRFNPDVHQALATEEAEDVEEPQVSAELQRGYRLHDRLLRPSLVKVKVPRKVS